MPDLTYRRRFGDRRDGRLLRSLSPFYRMTPYIMVNRNDACNCFSDCVEVSEAAQWFREKRQENWKGMGMLHLFIAAYIRTMTHCPGLNRFVSGQRIYARNRIEIVLAVKRAMTADAEETTIKVVFEPTDTVFDVYRRLGEKVDEIKANAEGNETEQTAATMMALPRPIMKFVMWILRLMDYFGGLPRALMDASPFHGSMIITDLGSIGTGPIYHHLYNFGNLPVFVAFGKKRRAVETDKNGVLMERRYIDFKVVMDERTVDGIYFANALKYLKYYIQNPALLETPPEQVAEDVF